MEENKREEKGGKENRFQLRFFKKRKKRKNTISSRQF